MSAAQTTPTDAVFTKDGKVLIVTERDTTNIDTYTIASDGLAIEIPNLRKLTETDIPALEKQLDAAGAPPTPGRLPDWKK